MLIRAAATVRARIEASLDERLSATLLLRQRIAPQMVTTGVPELDALTGGLPRGALSEIAGPTSSGRSGVMISALAAATRRQEVCALVDASDSFDPASAQAAGVELERLLWVRCGEQGSEGNASTRSRQPHRKALNRLDQVLRVTDLLLQGGGFGMVVLDMGDLPAESTRRVPLTSWFRFRRAVEPTATVLLLIEPEPCAKTCASLVVQLRRKAVCAQNATAEELYSASFVAGNGFRRGETAFELNERVSVCERQANVVPSAISHIVGCHVISSSPPALPANHPVSHASLLQELRVDAELVRSWTRKPVQAAHAAFDLSAQYPIG